MSETLQPSFLVIDDDTSLLRILGRGLTNRGFTVLSAENPTQALALCKEHQPEFVSLDLKLEHESGLHLIKQLKQLSPNCKIVMLTSYASIATAVDAIKLGAHQYLCKPVDIDELLNGFDYSPVDDSESANITQLSEKPTSVKRLEWEKIQQTLQAHDGNVSATARALGMHRRTLQRKLQKHPVKH
ncbi:response regulator transcription factor [Oceaniserpentilla sp. 4NH20-0058]|uniref:response regulator transcription factor n=1 Tax=Oceaniserpentilla sp. 4NH20-0058 TaxID=3127660 RepID=UPI003101E5CA